MAAYRLAGAPPWAVAASLSRPSSLRTRAEHNARAKGTQKRSLDQRQVSIHVAKGCLGEGVGPGARPGRWRTFDLCQAATGGSMVQRRSRRTRAFARTTSFRMTAVRADLARLAGGEERLVRPPQPGIPADGGQRRHVERPRHFFPAALDVGAPPPGAGFPGHRSQAGEPGGAAPGGGADSGH